MDGYEDPSVAEDCGLNMVARGRLTEMHHKNSGEKYATSGSGPRDP